MFHTRRAERIGAYLEFSTTREGNHNGFTPIFDVKHLTGTYHYAYAVPTNVGNVDVDIKTFKGYR
jgi:hypothetical protein